VYAFRGEWSTWKSRFKDSDAESDFLGFVWKKLYCREGLSYRLRKAESQMGLSGVDITPYLFSVC